MLAYAVRSATRGFDIRPDLPSDAIVLLAFLVVLLAVAVARHTERTEDDGEYADRDGNEQRGSSAEPRDDHEGSAHTR
jgi:hypothetical protein